MLRDDLHRPVAEQKEIAAAQLPEVQRSIVDSCCILRGHQRGLTQFLRILESENGIPQIEP